MADATASGPSGNRAAPRPPVVPLQPLPGRSATAPLDPAALSPLQRLQVANALALGKVADSINEVVRHPGKMLADTVHVMARMATHPTETVDLVGAAWQQGAVEGSIATGRTLTAYAGMAAMALGAGAVLGRVGAKVIAAPVAGRLFQQVARSSFAVAGIAGTGAVAVDAAALVAHEVQAAGATTTRELQRSVDGLQMDLTNLAANGAMLGVAKAAGAGVKALGNAMQEQELAVSLARSRQVRRALAAGDTAQAARLQAGEAIDAGSLADELSGHLGNRARKLNPDQQRALATYLTTSLSEIEKTVAGKAMGQAIAPGTTAEHLLGVGEQAVWQASGINPKQFAKLQRHGWTPDALREVRMALREAPIAAGQQPAVLRELSRSLTKLEAWTPQRGTALRQRAVRIGLKHVLQEYGVTRDLAAISSPHLRAATKMIAGTEPRTRATLVRLLNETRGRTDMGRFWADAYRQLYADLGVDPAVVRALETQSLELKGTSAFEQVYNQLRSMPAETRAKVSRAIAAMEIRPDNANRILRQVNTAVIAEDIRRVLPEAEKVRAESLAIALMQDVADGQSARMRQAWKQAAKQLPMQLLSGDTGAIPRFARALGGSKAATYNLVAGTTSAVARLPEHVRGRVFSGLDPKLPVGEQVRNRLVSAIRDEFGVGVRVEAGPANIDPDVPPVAMDAVGALHLHNALDRLRGTAPKLPKGVTNAVFARSDSLLYGGLALTGEDGLRYAMLYDPSLTGYLMSASAGTPLGEATWIHEAGHLLQGYEVDRPGRQNLTEWSKVSGWRHAENGAAPNGSNPRQAQIDYIYKDPSIEGVTREAVSDYGLSDPREDWAEYTQLVATDPTTAMGLAPHKFLYFAAKMPRGWAEPRLVGLARQAGVDLHAATNLVAERLGATHPVAVRIRNIVANSVDTPAARSVHPL